MFKIKHPIIQAGVNWCSGWKLAVAVSNAGGLGVIAGSQLDLKSLEESIVECQKGTKKSFGVSLSLSDSVDLEG